MDDVLVDLKHIRYPIIIGQGILDSFGKIMLDKVQAKKCAVITTAVVKDLYASRMLDSLNAEGFEPIILEVPDSETSKSLRQAEELYGKLLDNHFDRNSCIIALGGGVVGDLAGYVAATYMRGVPLVQVPTTLLAQVDSAIGGKVAVDLPKGKNLIGMFYQPRLVLSDIDTLKTLSEEELKSGMAEVIKYGIITDEAFFVFLEDNILKIKDFDLPTLQEIVTRCSRMKARIVEEDEKEQGRRVILNLGHTLGHALECATDYTGYTHGEAIAVGLVFASRLSVGLCLLDNNDLERIEGLIAKMNLPTRIKHDLDADTLIEMMKHDKKAKGGNIRFVLPKSIGEVSVLDDVSMELVRSELRKMLG